MGCAKEITPGAAVKSEKFTGRRPSPLLGMSPNGETIPVKGFNFTKWFDLGVRAIWLQVRLKALGFVCSRPETQFNPQHPLWFHYPRQDWLLSAEPRGCPEHHQMLLKTKKKKKIIWFEVKGATDSWPMISSAFPWETHVISLIFLDFIRQCSRDHVLSEIK